jgi:hypothetical protein
MNRSSVVECSVKIFVADGSELVGGIPGWPMVQDVPCSHVQASLATQIRTTVSVANQISACKLGKQAAVSAKTEIS